MELPEVVRAIDICHALGVSPATVRLWVRRGKLPQPTRISYHMRVWARAALLPYLEALKVHV